MIHVIFTGGTIGSALSDGVIYPDDSKKEELLARYKAQGAHANVEFFVTEPYYILSENLDGAYLNLLQDSIFEVLETEPDCAGIIVVQGTDTLQYAAAGTALLYYTCRVPIVFVSANYVLTDERSNGFDNFSRAVDFICETEENGKEETSEGSVYVSYKNKGEAAKIWNALTLCPHPPYSDLLLSVPFPRCGFKQAIERAGLELPPATRRFSPSCPVHYIRQLPGQVYPAWKSKARVVLFDTYHSGTLCTAGDAFTEYVEDADHQGLSCYILGTDRDEQYETTNVFRELPVHVLPGISPITAYMLLWLLNS